MLHAVNVGDLGPRRVFQSRFSGHQFSPHICLLCLVSCVVLVLAPFQLGFPPQAVYLSTDSLGIVLIVVLLGALSFDVGCLMSAALDTSLVKGSSEDIPF